MPFMPISTHVNNAESILSICAKQAREYSSDGLTPNDQVVGEKSEYFVTLAQLEAAIRAKLAEEEGR